MATVTPDVLIARLMEVHSARTREELARKLNVPLRTLQRWATGEVGMAFETAVDLLEQAGWLAVEGKQADHSAAHQRARRVTAKLADDLEELAGLLSQ
jgi:hypothetical protein